MKKTITIPVTKIGGIITIAEGVCASVTVNQLIKDYRQKQNIGNVERSIMNVGAHALSACLSWYFINKGVEMLFSKGGNITIPIGKDDKDASAEMDPKRVAEIKKALEVDKYIQGLINSYGDAVNAGVNSLQENSDGTIVYPNMVSGLFSPISSYLDWKEFIDVLNDYHRLMCKQNDDWNFENTCNELKKTIQWYWDSTEVNKK